MECLLYSYVCMEKNYETFVQIVDKLGYVFTLLQLQVFADQDYLFLQLDKAVVFRAVSVIVSRSDERAETLMEPAK